MKKKILGLFIFFCFALTHLGSIQANAETKPVYSTHEEAICYDDVIEYIHLQDYYESNEISLEYSFKGNSVTFSNIETNGGTLTDLSITDTLTLDFLISSENSSIQISNIYQGSTSNDTIYFSECDGKYFTSIVSEVQAKREALFYQFENGLISETEYLDASYDLIAQDITDEVYLESDAQTTDSKTTLDMVLKWEDDWEVQHTLNYTKVEIIKRVYFDGVLDYPYYDTVLNTLYSDKNGIIQYAFDSATEELYGYYVKVYAASVNTTVVDNNKTQYYYQSAVANNVPAGSTIYFNLNFDMDSDLGKAFQLSQAVHYASQYAKYLNSGTNLNNCTLCYGNSGAYYAGSTIYIKARSIRENSPQGYSDWDAVGHEYGHHVQACFPDIARNPGGKHYVNTNNADSQYTSGYSKYKAKDRGMKLSWAEGWATYFGQMMQQHSSSELQNIRFVNDDRYTASNGVNHSMLTKGYVGTPYGETDEIAIAQILFQLEDSRKEGNDVFSYTNRAIWQLITTHKTKSFHDFYIALYTYESKKNELSKFLSEFKITPFDLQCTSSVSKNISPSFVWTADNGSVYFPFDEYEVSITTSSLGEIYVGTTTDKAFTMPADIWNEIVASNDVGYTITIGAFATEAISTGPYYSETYSFDIDRTSPVINLIESDYLTLTPMETGAITSAGMKVIYADNVEVEEMTYEYTTFQGKYEKGTVESEFIFYRKGEYRITVTDTMGNRSIATFTITHFDLVVDPLGAGTVGTEVTENGGAYGDTTLSVGYTRCIYLGANASSQSRLDYTFTSSDESIATVSKFGTVEAKAAGTVVITCVSKKNPNQVSKIILTILP